MAEASSGKSSVVKVTGIHHLSIPCNDLDRAIAFYTEVLGMELVRVIKGDSAPHFLGTNVPPGLAVDNALAEQELQEYRATYAQPAPGRETGTHLAQLRAGNDQVVLFLRTQVDETDTLWQNGVFHQSFHISAEHMDYLAELKRRGDSPIRFHNGPALRWPNGRALYLWDSEGNYIEMESDEDLPSQYGLK